MVVWNLNGSQIQSQQVVTAGNDTIDASAAVNGSLHAYIGTGSDTVTGGAKADQIFTPNSNFASIDGGGGDDRLVLTSPGQVVQSDRQCCENPQHRGAVAGGCSPTPTSRSAVPTSRRCRGSTNYLYVVGGPDDHVDAGISGRRLRPISSMPPSRPGILSTNIMYSNGSLLFVDSTLALTITASPTVPVDANATANSLAEGAANGTAVGITASSSIRWRHGHLFADQRQFRRRFCDQRHRPAW